MLMEKVFAKVMGNYEQIVSGSPTEGFDFIGGSTSKSYWTTDTSEINSNGATAYELVEDALSSNYPVAGACCNNGVNYNEKDLVPGHAYTITGASTVTTASGDSVKLILVRNPHGQETWNGDWSDKDTNNWTDEVKSAFIAQNGDWSYTTGSFYMTADDYVKYFDFIYVGYFNDDYWNNYLEVANDDGNEKEYTISIPEDAGKTWIGVAFYPTRMYPSWSTGCSV